MFIARCGHMDDDVPVELWSRGSIGGHFEMTVGGLIKGLCRTPEPGQLNENRQFRGMKDKEDYWFHRLP